MIDQATVPILIGLFILVLLVAIVTVIVVYLKTRPRSGSLSGRFGPYQIMGLLSVGGIAEVYQAKNSRGAIVALKVLRRDWMSDAAVYTRFFREGEILQAIYAASPNVNVVRCNAVGREQKTHRPYLELEFLEARPLKELIATYGAQSDENIGVVAHDICSALSAAHGLGYCHSDLDPSNILVSVRSGAIQRATVIDFGVADHDDDLTGNALHDAILGKIDYMSPEQASGDRVTPASDLYSLGVVLYHMATGRLPFVSRTGNPYDVLEMHQREVPDPPVTVSKSLCDLICAMLEKDPARRPASALEVIKRLPPRARTGSEFEPSAAGTALTAATRRMRVAVTVLTCLVLGLSGALAYVISRSRPSGGPGTVPFGVHAAIIAPPAGSPAITRPTEPPRVNPSSATGSGSTPASTVAKNRVEVLQCPKCGAEYPLSAHKKFCLNRKTNPAKGFKKGFPEHPGTALRHVWVDPDEAKLTEGDRWK